MQSNLNYEEFQKLFSNIPVISPNFDAKVAVIGKGTASLLLIPSLLRSGIKEITVFFDSNKPELGVGESTVPTVQKQLASVGIFIESLIKNNIASYKTGVRFYGWGKSETFDHPFWSNDLAFHFYTKDFNNFVTQHYSNNKHCQFVDEKIDKVFENDDGVIINGKTYDFVIHASGWSDKLTEYIPSPFETVNTGITFTKIPHSAFTTTVHRATENGWQFELPYPEQNKSRCGYLFNRNISDETKILEKYEYDIESFLKWNPRYSKNLIISKRQALIGNALFFFEPLQAFSTHYYCVFSDMISECIGSNGSSQKIDDLNKRYANIIQDYLKVIAFHYKNGSKYDTAFWRDIVPRANNFCPDSTESFRFFSDFDYHTILSGMRGDNR